MIEFWLFASNPHRLKALNALRNWTILSVSLAIVCFVTE